MEFNREVLLQQHKLDDFTVQSSLCPPTPAKPAPTHSSNTSNGQKHHKSSEPNWPETLQGPSKTRRIGEDAVSEDCLSSSSNSSSRPAFLTYNPAEGGWRQPPGTNPSDWNPFFTLLLQSQIDDGLETQVHPNQFLFNNVPPIPNLSDGISPSTPKSMGNTINVSGTDGLPSSYTPETMEKNKHLREYLHQEVTCLVQERDSRGKTLAFDSVNWPSQIANQVNLYVSDNMVQQTYKTVVSTSADTLIPSSEFVEPLQVLFSDQQQNEVRSGISTGQDDQLLNAQKHELEKQGIDLNRTPQNMHKRRKHRPKVIQEGKPVRTPKPRTPKPATPKVAMINKESSTGKRNYVRKKMGQSSSDAFSSMSKDVVDPKNSNSGKSVRRCLNFDSDLPEARDVCRDPTMASTHGTPFQTLSSCLQDSINSSSTMSTIQFAQQFDGVMKKPESRMPLDLNGSVHQMPYVYVRSSQKKNSFLQQSRGEKFRTNQNLDNFEFMPENFAAPTDTGMRSNHVNDTITVDRNPDTSEVQSDSGGVSFAMPKQTKRNQNVIPDPYISNYREFMHAFGGIGQLNECLGINDHDLYFPKSFKKNRTENHDNELVLNAAFKGANMPTNNWRAKCIELNNHLMALKQLQASQQILDFGKIDKQSAAMTVRSHEPNSVHSNSDSAQTITLNNHQMPSPMKPFRGSDIDERERFENRKCNAVHPVRTSSKAKPKRDIMNRQAQLANFQLSNSSPILKKNHDPTALVSINLREKFSPLRTSPKSQSDSSCKNCQSDNSMSVAIKPCGDGLEDITEHIRHISIIDTHEDARAITENALVPYVVDSEIVPYGTARRRQTRPKVDLDEETFRVWNLLMGKGEHDCVEGKYRGKEKWWEEERKVFHGRVDSFIARMHLVQGDRRFSKWKGSVVDSVVGVFLTQNVSDHLSSSAYMALAARFSFKSEGNNEATHEGKKGISMEMQERCSASVDYSSKLQDRMLSKDLHCTGSQAIIGENESSNSNESLASDTRGCIGDCSRKFIDSNETLVGHETPHNSSISASLGLTGKTCLVEAEGRWSFDDAASSKNCIVSSQNSGNQVQTASRTELNSQSNLQDEDMITGRISNGIGSSPSFVELLLMADRIQPENFPSGVRQQDNPILEKKSSILDPSCSLGISTSPSGICFFNFSRSGLEDMISANVISDESRLKQLQGASGIINADGDKLSERSVKPSAIAANKITGQEKLSLVHGNKLKEDSCASTNKHFLQPATISETEACIGKKFYHNINFQKEEGETSTSKSFSKRYSHSVDEGAVEIQQRENDKFTGNINSVKAQMKNLVNQQNLINFSNKERNPLEVFQGVESNLKNEVHSSQRVSAETITKLEEKTVKVKKNKKGTFDWDSLRRGAHRNGTKERNNDTMDSIDWEAVRCAEVEEISDTIRERGMNNKLAERIKDFLNRLVEDHGSIDLEWLRHVEPDKVKDYLLSIQGLGLKSVECVRLLTLQHLAFPVDTNVGRICVRLGWVPLQPLPESLQLHLLELYPLLETIQKYLWPRLCKLDQRTLYELHYQMITFGKVFCTKSKPNCNACPMRGECKHFASAFASARLALPGPEEKRLATKTPLAAYEINHAPELQPVKTLQINHAPELQPVKPLQIEVSRDSKESNCRDNCEPIIEEPSTPEAEQLDTEESAIEDIFYEDPDEIPTIKLNLEEFTQNLHNYMQEHNLEIIDADMSKALVAINPEAASIPTPKLKNISRLRTEHHVYELPDSHPLLEGWELRERDDPSSYLLAIWTPGETAQSCELPEAFCSSQGTGKLCSSTTCFSCNSIREAEAQTVRGTVLIPCRTAMRGSFPLNGTYFQVNEVFADHDTSRNPINVPRKWLWNLPRRTVYFGLTTPEIQQCFWRGFVCVRGFDRTTRAPKPLYARLHFPASKAPKNKKTPTAKQQNYGKSRR